MSDPAFKIAPLDLKNADRRSFDCGVAPLNQYLHCIVGQDIRRELAKCYAVTTEAARIVGYYTLAAAELDRSSLADIGRGVRYATVPAVRVGRLAVATDAQKRGIGRIMLSDAVQRALRADIAVFALTVVAKDAKASAFYQSRGFVAVAGMPLSLFLPLATARKMLDTPSAT
jgi:GNAT superfamily N-acetyltransferase